MTDMGKSYRVWPDSLSGAWVDVWLRKSTVCNKGRLLGTVVPGNYEHAGAFPLAEFGTPKCVAHVVWEHLRSNPAMLGDHRVPDNLDILSMCRKRSKAQVLLFCDGENMRLLQRLHHPGARFFCDDSPKAVSKYVYLPVSAKFPSIGIKTHE